MVPRNTNKSVRDCRREIHLLVYAATGIRHNHTTILFLNIHRRMFGFFTPGGTLPLCVYIYIREMSIYTISIHTCSDNVFFFVNVPKLVSSHTSPGSAGESTFKILVSEPILRYQRVYCSDCMVACSFLHNKPNF